MNSRRLADLLASAPGPDEKARESIATRASQVLRPSGALNRLDQIAIWLAGWQRTNQPKVESPAVVLAASDHGVAALGVSAYPPDVTRSMVAAIEAGVATSSVLARSLGAELVLLDAGVGQPTGDLVHEDALSLEGFEERFEQGREAVASLRCDLLAIGEMGIGNTTAAAAVTAAVLGGEPGSWVGPGTGVTGETLETKREIVASAVSRVGTTEPLEALRRLGGGELVALAGVVTEARLRSIPVVLDGFVTAAAVVAVEAAVPGALEHCLASHVSAEPGHARLLEHLGMRPLLDLGMRLGEGSGALLAIPLVAASASAVVDVATFQEWGLE